ncbi:MAG: EamA family transporter [Candidatus Heimdallarchaeota archaeon]|nr:EamA family transporter [Candidatus Heimdallarchaeota archaeon]
MPSTVLAIIMAILAYSSLNIGLALEKKGASSLPDVETISFWQNLKNFFTNRTWLFGFLLTVVSFLFLVVAMNQGSLSVVAPLQAVGLLSLALFSHFYLHEAINSWELTAIVLIIIGVVLLGVTNFGEEHTYTLTEINNSFLQVKAILFISLLTGLMVLAMSYSAARKFHLGSIVFALAGGIFSGLGDIFTKAFMSGIDFGEIGFSFVSLLKQWVWWVYVLLMAFYNICAGILPQIAFQKGKAVIVAPIFSIMTLTIPVFGGMIIFSEWANLATWVLAVKSLSLLLLVIGVVLLSYSSVRPPEQEQDKDKEIIQELFNK